MDLPICYRCRGIITYATQSIECCQCYRNWHLNCLIQPIHHKTLRKNWKCPQHDGRTYARKHKLVKKNHSIIKVKLPEEDLTFPEADKIVDYGGVVCNMKASDIESDFLNYARKYRNHQTMYTQNHAASEASEWLESLESFQFPEMPRFQNDGIQMILDAANMEDTMSISSHTSKAPKDVKIDTFELERYQAIEELIQLKGQDKLISLLK